MILFEVIFCILLLKCTDLPITPRDLNYEGYYSLELSLPKTEYYAYGYYKAAISQGDDEYESINIYSEPAGAVISEINQKNDTITMYFRKSFEGKVCVAAIKPNKLSDTVKYTISVKNPFVIEGDTSVLINDTATYTVIMNEENEASENVKSNMAYRYSNEIPLTLITLRKSFSKKEELSGRGYIILTIEEICWKYLSLVQ